MKKFLVVGLLCVSAPAMAASVWNSPADVAAIIAIEQQNKVHRDGADMATTFAPDAVVLNYMTGEIYEGRSEIQKAATAMQPPFKSASSNIREQSILTNGSFACVLQTVDYQFVTKDGQPGTLSLRQMNALKKNGGRWEIVQEHLSAPMDPTTGLAVTNNLQVRGNVIVPTDMKANQRVSVAQAEKELKIWTHDSFLVLPVDALMQYYGPGPNDLAAYAPTTPGNLRGIAELRAYLAPGLADTSSLEITVPHLKIDTDGELGAQIDVQFIKSNFKSGKPSETTYWRQSDCLRRVDGKWHGVMAMASFPVDLKTGKSVVLVTTIPANLKTSK